MYSSKQYFFGFLLLFSTIGSSLMVLHSGEDLANKQQANTPESYMINATMTRMNEDTGLPEDQLYSPYVVHYLEGDKTDFNQPVMVIYQETGEPWHLSSDQGQATYGVNTIKLWGNVVLVQTAGPQNPAMTIKTTAATIFPKDQYAVSDQPLTAEQPDKNLKAVGMHAYFKTGIIDLLSQVQGVFLSQPSKS